MAYDLRDIIKRYTDGNCDAIEVITVSAAEPGFEKAHIYAFYDLDHLSGAFAVDYMHILPPTRRQRCAAYQRQRDRDACVLAYLLLLEGLRQQFGITGEINFTFNQRGKPYLRDTPQIFFNISHSGNNVVCAFAEREIGIDIQELLPVNMGIARKVFSDSEVRLLEGSDNPRLLFCRLWTEKESYAKSRGADLTSVFKRQLPAEGFVSWERKDAVMTLCWGERD